MITQMPNGSFEFRLFARDAARAEILGSFTGWRDRPIPMRRQQDGWFVVRCEIEQGDYEFQYLIDGSIWQADYGASGVRLNEFGLWVSQLTVPEVCGRRLVVETRAIRPGVTPAPGGRVRLPAA